MKREKIFSISIIAAATNAAAASAANIMSNLPRYWAELPINSIQNSNGRLFILFASFCYCYVCVRVCARALSWPIDERSAARKKQLYIMHVCVYDVYAQG